MLNSTSSSTRPALSSSCSSSSCTLNSFNHVSKPPIIASPSALDLHAPHPHPHPALVIPLSRCHHLHSHPNLDSSSHCLYPLPHNSITASINSNAAGPSGIFSESFSSHSFSTDPHCYTTDCSPRSVIRHNHSSSSGPSPDPGHPSSYSTHCFSNASTPRAKSHNIAATWSSTTRVPHCPSLHETSQAYLLRMQSQQSMMQNHLHRYPPWSSPASVHHHCLDASSRSLSTSSERSYTTVGLMQAACHVCSEAEIEEGNNQDIKMRRSPKSVPKGSPKPLDTQRERHFRSGHCSGSAAVDKPCVKVESKEADGCNSGKQAAAMDARLRSDTESDYGVNAHPHRYPRASIDLSDPLLNSVPSKGVDHRQRIHENRSYSCNLHNAEGGSRASSRQSCSAVLHQSHKITSKTTTSLNELAPRSSDALLGYVDGMENHHDYYPASKGSKWEDAEKWLMPANHSHHHHPTGCRGLIPSLGLLRMSGCMNAHGTSIKPVHFPNPQPASAPCTTDYNSAHSHCTVSAVANYMNHSGHAPFNAANAHNDCSSAQEQANLVVNHPSSATRQFVHLNCFHPQLISCNSNIPYAQQCSPAPHDVGATNQGIIGGLQVTRQWSTNPQLQAEGISQLHHDSSGFCMMGKSNASSELKLEVDSNFRVLHCDEQNQGREYSSIKEAVPSLNERNMLPLPPPGSVHHQCISNQLTDRFASGDSMPCSSTPRVYETTSDKNILVGPSIKGSVAMPMVSLREVGTQMSSIDGSGSISRYTSKSGSPQKNLSPARHNTPAQIRSLSGSASNSGNVRRSAKQFINLEELVECHRAKLELQALSEGERIHSFHRTTSTWSSREVEEADLSRSLRHSTPELENQPTTSFSHQWPTQSYSWNKDDDSKLAKLQLKEAQIRAWEDKKKSKADAKLKRLEENLAKKRSQTTIRIMESLAAAQRKAEEMRASVYAQQRRTINKGRRLRPRSLSPFSRCSCFSALQ